MMHCLQAAWSLKLRALTEQTYIDEVENDEEGMAEILMDENAIADLASQHTFNIYNPQVPGGYKSMLSRAAAEMA